MHVNCPDLDASLNRMHSLLFCCYMIHNDNEGDVMLN